MSEHELPEPPRPDPKAIAEATPHPTTAPNRTAFVEPEISAPVDVLEATTFFQAATSGPIDPPL